MVRFAIAWEMLYARHILCTFRAAAPSRPASDTASTLYSLYSDPDHFTSSEIQNAVHYLHDELTGTLWLDDDGDGKRVDPDNDLNDAIGENLWHRRRIIPTHELRHRRDTTRRRRVRRDRR